jgi:cytochrome c biogenesis protein CcmG, thiol:disulfide interchange protein DsbE
MAAGLIASGRLSAAPEKGKPAPAFSAQTLDGKKIALADYTGKSAVILNFFASWWPSCRAEYPHLKEIDEQYGKRGVQVISISVDDDRDKAGSLRKQVGGKFPVIHDAGGKVAELYGVTAIPLNVVVDTQGNVDQVILGADTDALKSAAERLAKPK